MAEPRFFDDPRHKTSGEFAFLAQKAADRGDDVEGRRLYALAAQVETELALGLPTRGADRLRALMAISAVALWCRAGNLQQAQDVAAKLRAAAPLLPKADAQVQAILDKLVHG